MRPVTLARCVIFAIALGFAAALAAYAPAGPSEDGSHADSWLISTFELAEQGDADMQALLGLAYREGIGVPQDYAEAAKWYRLAAEQGNAPSDAQVFAS